MLTMSFVYFNIWQIKQTEPKDFAMGLIGFGEDIEKSLLEATSPFVCSTVNEHTMLRFLKLIACDNGKIGTYAKLVLGVTLRYRKMNVGEVGCSIFHALISGCQTSACSPSVTRCSLQSVSPVFRVTVHHPAARPEAF